MKLFDSSFHHAESLLTVSGFGNIFRPSDLTPFVFFIAKFWYLLQRQVFLRCEFDSRERHNLLIKFVNSMYLGRNLENTVFEILMFGFYVFLLLINVLSIIIEGTYLPLFTFTFMGFAAFYPGIWILISSHSRN